MASDKRDFKNFAKFPGKYNCETKLHEFPTLWKIDSMGRTRMWKIVIRVIKNNTRRQIGVDWNLMKEDHLPIKKEYYKTGYKIYPDIIAQAYVETGIIGGKITLNSPSYFEKVAFEGQANERNVFQQALIYARNQFLQRKQRGSTEKKPSKNKKTTSTMYFPMLAKPYKTGAKHLVYPLYVQPKLDGVRCITYLSKPSGDYHDVIMYSRTKKIFPTMDFYKKLLHPLLDDLYDREGKQSIYLDGELYLHGKTLQDISGESRGEAQKTRNINQYHIYDCFYPKELSTEFAERKEQLAEFFSGVTGKAKKFIIPVKTKLVKHYTEARKQFDYFVKHNYEGIILRNVSGVYKGDPERTGAFLRSNDLVKMKKEFTDEYEVVDYTEGTRGKDKGAIIWIVRTKSGIRFNVTPKDTTYEIRYKLFKDAEKNFKKKYKNRMITVEYKSLSKDKVPQHAKSLAFRDYE